jgi:hypothetical protein
MGQSIVLDPIPRAAIPGSGFKPDPAVFKSVKKNVVFISILS